MTTNTRRIGQYLQTLTVTALVAFLIPLVLVVGLWLGLSVAQRWLPLAAISQQGLGRLVEVLTTLGGGNPWQGGLALGIAFSLVGILFDLYTFYRHQGLIHR
ncbi:MAG: hypothetical protein ACFCVD_05090 [Nodosilinea sp.]